MTTPDDDTLPPAVRRKLQPLESRLAFLQRQVDTRVERLERVSPHVLAEISTIEWALDFIELAYPQIGPTTRNHLTRDLSDPQAAGS